MEKYAYMYFRTPTGRKKIRIRVGGKKEEIKTGYIITPSMRIIGTGIISGRSEASASEQRSVSKIESQKEVIVPGIAVGGDTYKFDEPLKEVELLRRGAIEVPEIKTETPVELDVGLDDIKVIDIKYPLIPREPKHGERVFAYAHIYFERKSNELVYNVVEPPISDDERRLLDDIKEFIEEKLEINFAQIRKAESVKYIEDIFEKAKGYFGVKGDPDILKYYVVRDFVGLEMLEPLLQDKNIEDISCDGVNIPVYVYHRDPKLGSLKTNTQFSKRNELDSFVNKLSERCGKSISFARPLLDGTLPDGSRVQATLGSDIARHGSNFTIRMFTEKPLTPVDMIIFNTIDTKLLAYMWFLVEHEASILISGGTASGKTSTLNVLSLFIKPQMKIVSIEDTSELRLPHSHWVPEVARTPINEEGKVDMFELLRESLRQRPDYIIVGEVRGKEAYVLFQQMAVGHAGLATIHADSFPKLMDRLTTPPIGLPPNLIQNLDAILFIKRMRMGKKYSRRISMITEILGYDHNRNQPVFENIFKWNPVSDQYSTIGKSAILRKIANSTGMSESDIQEELRNRANVLQWMVRRNIRDYKKVSSIINLYYLSPDFLMKKIEGGL